MPYFSTIPGIIAIIIGVAYTLDYYLYKLRPKWTKPFVPEYPPENVELPSSQGGKQRLGWVLSLLLISAVGLAAKLVQLIPPGLDSTHAILAASWVSIMP